MLGDKFIGGLMTAENSLHEYIKLRPQKDLFRGPEVSLFEFVDDHVQKYGELPSSEALNDALQRQIIEIVPNGEISEAPSYYLDKMRDRHVHLTLKTAIESAVDDLNNGKPQKAKADLTEIIMGLHYASNHGKIVNYAEEAEGMLATHLLQVQKFDDRGLRLGWESFDDVAGGLNGGDLVSFVGRTGMGKTFMLLYAMLYGWKRQAKRPLFISMEMKPNLITERLAAMDAQVSLTQIKTGEIPTKKQNFLIAHLGSNHGKTPLYIVDGALAATVDDIVLYCRQFQPDSVFIDGAYLIRDTKWRSSKWESISEIVYRIKGELAEGLNIPVVASYQLNRASLKRYKGKTNEGTQHIAGADSIGQVSSIVLGLLQNEEDDVETKVSRVVSVLKGRYGETGQFKINWSFNRVPFMDFGEIPFRDTRELEHL